MKWFEISIETLYFLGYAGILVLACFVAGAVINFILFRILTAYNKRRRLASITYLTQHTRKPMHLFIPMLLVLLFSSVLASFHYYQFFNKAIYVVFYASFAWLLIRLVYVLSDAIIAQHDITAKDNLSYRKLYTQLQFLRRLMIIIVVTIFVSVILLHFDHVRKLGAGILTSAGIAGVIIGFAAQRSLGNLLAGLQIAFTQPIRIDDVVIIENEWGRVEEITLSYVVVKIWDLRRLVVPLNYFIERPFQNWTKTSADIIGSVSLFLDYNAPVEELREEVTRLLASDPLWDGKVNAFQVVNASEKTIEVRALMSAKDAGNAWDLRCNIREKLLQFVQKNCQDSLPKTRAEVNLNKTNLTP